MMNCLQIHRTQKARQSLHRVTCEAQFSKMSQASYLVGQVSQAVELQVKFDKILKILENTNVYNFYLVIRYLKFH